MSRHRNVRTLNYDEEYDTVFDVYGQSVEEDCCISPTTAAEFIYDRNSKSNQSMSAFLSPAAAQVLEEEDEEDDDNDTSKGSARLRADSISGIISSLNQLDRAKLLSCVEEMQNVVGDTIPESRLATAAMQNHYNLEKSLAAVLSKIGEEPKPQRVIKERPPREKEIDLNDITSEVACGSESPSSDDSLLKLHRPPVLNDRLSNSSKISSFLNNVLTSQNFKSRRSVDSNLTSRDKSGKELHLRDQLLSSRNSGCDFALLSDIEQSSVSSLSDVRKPSSFTEPSTRNSDLSKQPLSSLVHTSSSLFGGQSALGMGVPTSFLAQKSGLHAGASFFTPSGSKSQIPGPKFSLAEMANRHLTSLADSAQNETARNIPRLPSPSKKMNVSLADLANQHLEQHQTAFLQPTPLHETRNFSKLTQNHVSVTPTLSKPLVSENRLLESSPFALTWQNASTDSSKITRSASSLQFPDGGTFIPLSELAQQHIAEQSNILHSNLTLGSQTFKPILHLGACNSLNDSQNDEKVASILSKQYVSKSSLTRVVLSDSSSKQGKPSVSLTEYCDEHSPIPTISKDCTVPKLLKSEYVPSVSNPLKFETARDETDLTKSKEKLHCLSPGLKSIFSNTIIGLRDPFAFKLEAKPSAFAFALCRRAKLRRIVYEAVKDAKMRLNQAGLKRFSFKTPSPDDIIKMKQKGSVVPKIEEEKQQIPEPPAVPSTTCVTSIQGEWISIGPDKTRETDNLPAEAEESSKSKTFLEPFERRERKSRSPSPLPNGRDPTDGAASARKSKAAQKNSSEEYAKERGSGKLLLNLVVIGHVDAGKSTLMGHLLYRLGCVTKRAMHKYEQDSKKLGKASFMYAWVLDETSEERNRGITMDVAQSKFETSQRSVTLLDAPGHKDFIPNMITGAAQADVAILVVDATRGEFETGFEAGGQTREHTVLVRSLGVSQLAVVVNKLDNVDWSEDRYKEIEAKLSTFLKQVGFKESDVFFVPCSGLTGENLTSKSDSKALSTWYKGPCLVDIIDGFKPPERPVSKPFRMCIGDIFKGTGSGFCVGGRIESGHVVAGDRLSIMPAGEVATIKSITIDEMTVPQAFAGDHVTMVLSGVDQNKVACGDVVCDSSNPIRASSRFQARVVLFNVTLPLTKGFPVVLHYQSMNEQAVVRKILTHLHKSTGEMLKKKPRCLLKNSSGEIELEVNRPICIELYKDFKDLGRFMLRSAGITIAAGMVTKISN